ncbi:hypothetical protein GQ457_03G029550 [Hibiscus cannabinus]
MFFEYKTLPVTMVNQENFLKQRITKVTERLKQLREENRKMELTHIMYQNLGREVPLNLKKEDSVELIELIDEKLKAIDKRIQALAKQENYEDRWKNHFLSCLYKCTLTFNYKETKLSIQHRWGNPLIAAARSLFSEYKTLPVTRMVNQENFLKQRITKVTEEPKQLREENRKMELTQIMYENLGREGPLNVKKEDFVELIEFIDEKLKAIDKRIQALAKQEN